MLDFGSHSFTFQRIYEVIYASHLIGLTTTHQKCHLTLPNRTCKILSLSPFQD